MDCRRFEINLISASDLECVRKRFKMKVYAVVTVGDKQETEKQTPVDKENETNPAWNFTFRYTVGERALNQDGVMIVIKLYCSRTLGDRYIGEVRISIRELYSQAMENGGSITLKKNVQRGGSDATQGQLQFACSFGEKVIIEPPPPGSPNVWKKGAKVLLAVILNLVGVGVPLFLDDDSASKSESPIV
ncbi:hypothetical protein CEY00_Acc12223 [Actinidia chinensis var. chinensis]|uniref:C2 domain-containing protein n=1 Tax=Actinidia chinensis var. chinensis TaxID=1590841 RepID=A0A2R6QYF5_ACTCC|nr:hypothetical protein CEY00_Acc12223 [Actinidia chinensis var. chinensis]